VKVQAREEKKTGVVVGSERGARGGPITYQRVVPIGFDADVNRAKVGNASDGILTVSVPKRSRDESRETRP